MPTDEFLIALEPSLERLRSLKKRPMLDKNIDVAPDPPYPNFLNNGQTQTRGCPRPPRRYLCPRYPWSMGHRVSNTINSLENIAANLNPFSNAAPTIPGFRNQYSRRFSFRGRNRRTRDNLFHPYHH